MISQNVSGAVNTKLATGQRELTTYSSVHVILLLSVFVESLEINYYCSSMIYF